MLNIPIPYRPVISLCSLLLLNACTAMPEDPGRVAVVTLVEARGVNAPETVAERQYLSNQSLTAEAAVTYAIQNNADLQARFAQLGIPAADLYEATRIQNPTIATAILDPNGAGLKDQRSLSIVVPLIELVTIRARSRMADAAFAAAIEEVAFEVLNLAGETHAAFHEYVAAKEIDRLRAEASKVATLSFRLTERFHEAGNISAKDLELARADAAESSLASLEAKSDVVASRVALSRLLGAPASESWDTQTNLVLPRPTELKTTDLHKLALQNRLDLSAAKIRADYLADRLGVTNWSRWLTGLGVAYEQEKETDGGLLEGFSLEWEIPLFSFDRGEISRLKAELKVQMAALTSLSLEVGNEVQLHHERLNNLAQQVQIYHGNLLPARREATLQAQQEQNFMLIGVFELIETRRREFEAYEGFIEVVRDYWLARTALTRSVGSRLPDEDLVNHQPVDIGGFLSQPQNLMSDPETNSPSEHQHH